MTIVQKPLQAPNFCIICKHSNDVDYWDTTRYLDAAWPLPERGRKYVCKDCILSAAKEFGFITPEEATILKDKADYLEQHNKDLSIQADLVAAAHKIADTLSMGISGQAAKRKAPVEQSKPDTAKVKGSKIISTVTPENAPK